MLHTSDYGTVVVIADDGNTKNSLTKLIPGVQYNIKPDDLRQSDQLSGQMPNGSEPYRYVNLYQMFTGYRLI